MIAPARRSRVRADYGDEPYGYGEFLPGERIGPPLGRGPGRALLRGLVILIVLGGGWALVDAQSDLPKWLVSEIVAAYSSWDWSIPKRIERPAPAAFANAPSGPGPAAMQTTGSAPAPLSPAPEATASLEVPPRPVVTTVPPVAATAEAAAPATGEVPGTPLPPPTVDPTDPYQRRAEAVGLHPQLSRVLLARLSPTDYRNAGIAIETAVSQTPDHGVLVWPRQRTPEQALFQVRFVAGAAPGCRRYVVSVTKDGWLTTAPPMEKCSAQLRRQARD
ncbi:MAG: hypothetical protein J2P51_10120 [Hyphomicrobiaceae bacterium]|nr:hypothetical protein [Hyphomicrobiaceae bacterium]